MSFPHNLTSRPRFADAGQAAGSRPANLEHLRKQAKRRLRDLRATDPAAKLADAQRIIAREHGFASWRQLKAAADETDRARVFAAARAGDVQTVRSALEDGFHPGTTDDTGRTVHQIAKTAGYTALELLMREHQERDRREDDVKRAIAAIQEAAADGRADDLRRLLDEHPELIDARGVDVDAQTALHKAAKGNHGDCVRLLLEADADVRIRDYGDNAYALHLAAHAADVEVVEMLLDAGSDALGDGDDHGIGVLGWATCLGRVRADVASLLLGRGARLDIWSAIALDRADDVRRLVQAEPTLLEARMSRNEHRRTPLHHAAAVRRPHMVRLLLDLGAPIDAVDATGGTALTVAAREGADPSILAMLGQAGARLDLLAAVALQRFDLAARMLADDPGRLGPDGKDTIALHVLVAKRNASAVRWLIDHGIDVDAKRALWDCSSTALHVTAEHGLVELARMLLDVGANPAIRDDKYDATVLEWAQYCGQPAITELLRQRGVTA